MTNMKKDTWFTKPKIINYIPKNKIILFVDESGNNSKKAILNSITNSDGKSIRDDVYLLNGIIMDGTEYPILTKRFNRIKRKLSTNGNFDYPGKGLRPINLHNVEIDGHKKPFNVLYDGFHSELNDAISKTKFVQISAGINYFLYARNKTSDINPLFISLGILLNKFATFLNTHNNEGIIVLETENITDDMTKLNYIKRVLKRGTKKHDASYYSKITAVYFRPKWAYISNEWKTCAGLELADLNISGIRRLYHPEFIAIENKMLGYPNYGRDSINIVK